MIKFNEFLVDDAGAVTIDWIVLTAGILVVSLTVFYSLFSGGMASAVIDINGLATELNIIDVGTPPDPVTFGG